MNKSTLSLLASIAGLSLIKRKTTGSSGINPSKLDKYVDIDFYFVGNAIVQASAFEWSEMTEESFIDGSEFWGQLDSILGSLDYASIHWRYRGFNRLSSMYPVPSLEANNTFEIFESGDFYAMERLIYYLRANFEENFEYLDDVEDFTAFGGYEDESLFQGLEYLSTIFISFDSYKLEVNNEYALTQDHPDDLDGDSDAFISKHTPFKLKCRFLLNQNPQDIVDAMVFFFTQVVNIGFSDGIDAEIDVDVGFKYIIDPMNRLSSDSRALIFGQGSELRRF